MNRLIFATNNANKVSEIQIILKDKYEINGLAELGYLHELPETHDTLEGNALEKAEFIFKQYGMPCFAEDSGLEIESLNGEPGVYSARYAGDDRSADANMDKVLEKMEGIKNRDARFRTVIAYIDKSGAHFFEGIVEGTITTSKSGSGGFGYDPIFKPEGMEKTFGEMSIQEKNAISHRAQAVQKFIKFVELLFVF